MRAKTSIRVLILTRKPLINLGILDYTHGNFSQAQNFGRVLQGAHKDEHNAMDTLKSINVVAWLWCADNISIQRIFKLN